MFDPVDEEKREEERLLRSMRRAVTGSKPSPIKPTSSPVSAPMSAAPSPVKQVVTPQPSPMKQVVATPQPSPVKPATSPSPGPTDSGAPKKHWRQLMEEQEQARQEEERRRHADIAEQRRLDELARKEKEERERLQDQYWNQAAPAVLQRGNSSTEDDILAKLLGTAASLENSSSIRRTPSYSSSSSPSPSSSPAPSPISASEAEVRQIEARVNARSEAEARSKEAELAALTQEKADLEAQRLQLRRPAFHSMEDRTAYVVLVVKLVSQLIIGYTSINNTRLVEGVSALRDILTDIVEVFDALDRGASGKGQELVRAASSFIQTTVTLSEVASRLPVQTQLAGVPALTTARQNSAASVVDLLRLVKSIQESYATLNSKRHLIEAGAAIAGAVREAGLKLEQAVLMMGQDDRTFVPESFAELMSQIGLIVKNSVIAVLDPVQHAEARAKLIQALTELLLQSRAYKDNRSITNRTLVTAALTNLMSSMATLVLN